MQRSPEQRLRLLDCVFLRFDELVGEHPGALKIETVGGVYLVAANSARPFFFYLRIFSPMSRPEF